VLATGQVSLTVFDEEWRIQPSAAITIPTLANGGLQLLDGGNRMRTTWQIDPDLKWPDGMPVTADDFVFAHKVITDPRYEVADRTVTDKVEAMQAAGADRRTLVVDWKQVFAFYHNYGNHRLLPRHVVQKRYLDHPDTLATDPFGTRPLLPGGFTVSDWVRGSHIVVERNGAARGKWQPWFDRIVFRIIPSTSALEANLISGTIDAISSGWLPLDRVEALADRHSDSFDFHFVEGLSFEHIDCNLDNPILADVRVRRALLHGVDRERLARDLYGHRQPVAHSWVPPRRRDHNNAVRRYPYDPTQAARLLDEAGYLVGADGLRAKDGTPLKLTIMTTSGHATRERIEQRLQGEWRKLGIELEIRNQPAKLFFSETLRRRAFSGLAMYTWTLDPMHDSSTLWRCDQIPSADNGWRGQNYPGWCNEEVTSLHRQIERELDEGIRDDLMRRQQLLWADALPVLPLFFQLEPSVTVKRLRGWKPTGTLVPVTWNATAWRFAD
ncbi:MAG: peptide ABC transporter substrate-binding protein, partial [Deltaproteobacteria bacterium]|nr:peptide ABC transporter substrate-binding protein [Deltaproteobacteria bacterium]